MDKQTKIEVMAEQICQKPHSCDACDCNGCGYQEIATVLVDNGYGNINQALTEFADKLKEKFIWFCNTDGKSHKVIFIDDVVETLKEYTANGDIS